MNKDVLKRIATGSTEMVVSVLIALVFFLVFSGLLYLLFPSGGGFSALLHSAERRFLTDADGADRLLRVTDGSGSSDGFLGGKTAARLVDLRNKVASKPASRIAWSAAAEGMELFDRDAIQTFDRSSAVIQFDRENRLSVGANSVVVIRQLNRDPLFREQRSFRVVVDGELRGRLAASPEKAVFLEVETPSAIARIQTQDAKKGNVDFKITVDRENKSSVITMLRGPAQIEANGRTVPLPERMSIAISPEGALQQPKPIPQPVLLRSPADGTVAYYRDLPPKVVFGWQPVAGVEEYVLTIGTGPLLEDPVAQEHLGRPSFSHGNLRSGTYYWQVAAIRRGEEQRLSEIRKFTIIRDTVPPVLAVDPLPQTVEAGSAIVTGSAEPGSRVYIMGKAVETGRAGRFAQRIALRRGVNIVLVEAVDAAGNSTYRSQMVNGKF